MIIMSRNKSHFDYSFFANYLIEMVGEAFHDHNFNDEVALETLFPDENL